MTTDPLHRKIVARLSENLDGDKFERCAQDLLQDAYPSLAPVVGGSDAGMDGSVGTPRGAYPLICTTSPRVVENVRRNLEAYLAKRRGPRRAVVATSRKLTPQRKRDVEAAAADLGVTIVNIHDQPYFADRLYRNPAWRLELLGIAGDVPALSILPPRGRLAPVGLLIGRADEIDWLRDATGDALLVGQPGAGKTYLYQHLAAEGFCLFVADCLPARLADAVREQDPGVVVVDDAHINLELLRLLIRLRAELRARFAIHANCWPLHDGEVRLVMGLPPDRARQLGPLTRKEVLQLVNEIGVAGPDALLHLLLDQSDGKPGLATELAETCKRSGVDRVWSGEALADLLLSDRRLIHDEQDRCVLAAFAVGGDEGMRWRSVADALGVTQVELRSVTAGLGAGGVVEQVGEDRLQVRPPALRAVLVRDVFFGGADSLDIGPLLATSPSPAATAHVLMSARSAARGSTGR